jgi:hypothetical protein
MSKNAFGPGGKAYEKRKDANKRKGPRREAPAEPNDDWRNKKKQEEDADSDENESGSGDESGSEVFVLLFFPLFFSIPLGLFITSLH